MEEWKWSEYNKMSHSEKRKNITLKTELDAYFYDNPYYKYAEALDKYEKGNYKAVLSCLAVCDKYMADYDVQLLKVQSLLHLKKYDEAEHYAVLAHCMCPNRFYPLYYLAVAYYAENKKNDLFKVHEDIRNKNVKVNSWDIMVIRRMSEKMCVREKSFCVDSLIDIK